MPDSQTFLFNCGSRRTSLVPCLKHTLWSEDAFVAEEREAGWGEKEIQGDAKGRNVTYHGQQSKLLDLFDRPWSSLFERNTMNLYFGIPKSVFRPMPFHCEEGHNLDFIKPIFCLEILNVLACVDVLCILVRRRRRWQIDGRTSFWLPL